jgi:Aspartyl/Asparaginyl beta-hydroxylase
MRSPELLLRLPMRFDVAALTAELAALPLEAWVPHPDKIPGNEAVRLITPDGGATEGVSGNMAATPYLRASPYMAQVLAAIGGTWGRARLMKLAPGTIVPPHVDTNFYWRRHVRLHVPIITTPEVLFTCNDQTVHMAAGECWMFDTFSMHHVINNGPAPRVHLVMDTVGGDGLWDLVRKSKTKDVKPIDIEPGEASFDELSFERDPRPGVMSPWELRYHVAFAIEHAVPHSKLATVIARLDRFVASWTGGYARFGDDPAGTQHFQSVIADLEADLLALGGETIALTNKLPLYRQLAELLHAAIASLSVAPPLHRPQAVRVAR